MLDIHTIINGYLTTIFVFMGVFLNIISIILLRKNFKNNSTVKKRINVPDDNNEILTNIIKKSSSENGLNNMNSKVVRKFNKTSSAFINLSKPSVTICPVVITCVTRPKIYIYFTWITLCDTALLIFAFLMYGAPTIGGQSYEYLNAPFTPLIYLFCNTTMVASVWLMCALMYDRYRALTSKLNVALSIKSVKEKDIHKMLALVFISSLIYTLPRFFELKITYKEIEVYNGFSDYILNEDNIQIIPIPIQTDLVRNNFYMIGYRVIGGFLFYSLIPYILLFGASTKISIELHKTTKRRQKMLSTSISNNKISNGTSESNKILFAVMAKFLISRLMPTILDVVECLVGADSFNNDYYYVSLIIDISNFIIVVASGTNFFIFNCYKKLYKKIKYKKKNEKSFNFKLSNQRK
uniref:G_PROTEIN_RECEP_F1_2 domain-containing protein n=1 Tax=Strongyloides stercoralis TaxID=6248 RepID=A0A0K0E9X3_STRER